MQRSKLWTTEKNITQSLSLLLMHQPLGPHYHDELHYSPLHFVSYVIYTVDSSRERTFFKNVDFIEHHIYRVSTVSLWHGNQEALPWLNLHTDHKGSFSSHL